MGTLDQESAAVGIGTPRRDPRRRVSRRGRDGRRHAQGPRTGRVAAHRGAIPVVSVLAQTVLAALLSICSEADAFVAASHPDQPATGPQPGPAHRGPRIAWLFLLPLFALLAVTPPALDSYAADRAGTALQRPPGFAELPAGDPMPLVVVDYAARAVYDQGHSLGDRRVEIIGFVTVGSHGTPYLTRMVLNCCAADALPVKVGLSGHVPPDLRPDMWLDVVGTYTDRRVKDDVNGGPTPFIEVSQARPVPAPHDQYES
jgi:uncharacterized repeat protein (TIGR03943 family)